MLNEKAMDSPEFISQLATTLGLSESEVDRRVQAFADILTSCGETLDSISVPRFGNFDIVKEDEREDVDLSTGRRLLMPPSISLRFTPSAILRKSAEKGAQR